MIKMTKNEELFDLECNDGTGEQGLDIGNAYHMPWACVGHWFGFH